MRPWSKAPPTEPGAYWLFYPSNLAFAVAQVAAGADGALCVVLDTPLSAFDRCWWLGPLPPPPAPPGFQAALLAEELGYPETAKALRSRCQIDHVCGTSSTSLRWCAICGMPVSE